MQANEVRKLDNQKKTGEKETGECMTLQFIIKEQYTMQS